MTDPKNQSTETAIAVMATENQHTREKLDSIEDKLDRIDRKLDTKVDRATVQTMVDTKADKTDLVSLRRTVDNITKAIWIVGTTVLTAITTAILKLLGLIG
ncbi:hypothetical protein [Brevundimonas olei]|uniref:hypothetical protein n=1 Tax=Brevundimonas olei TaxID=657642 RepID=UPI0031D73951